MSSISSIASPPPLKPPEVSPPKAPEVKTDTEANAGASQPTVLAALPPGQGTRINQLV
jgi:hypothetical protein